MKRLLNWAKFCLRNPKVRKLTKLQRKWVKALVMYPERQIKGRLRDLKGGMCCLGQYCDVVDPKGWDGDVFDGAIVALPVTLVGPGHFHTCHGFPSDGSASLATRNDDLQTWPEIAEFVVNNQDKVFA